jgi:hypothetical protein
MLQHRLSLSSPEIQRYNSGVSLRKADLSSLSNRDPARESNHTVCSQHRPIGSAGLQVFHAPVTLASKQIPKKVTPLKRNSSLLKTVLRIIEPYFFYAIPH